MAEVPIDPQVVIRNLLNEIQRLNAELAIVKAALTSYQEIEEGNTEEG